MSNNISKDNAHKLESLIASEQKNRIDIEYIKDKIDELGEDIRDVNKTMKEEYTSLAKFKPVELLAFGLAAGILATVLGAILTLVIAPKISAPPAVIERVVHGE